MEAPLFFFFFFFHFQRRERIKTNAMANNLAVIPHFLLHYKITKQYILPEAVVQRCSVKKVFLESSQNS